MQTQTQPINYLPEDTATALLALVEKPLPKSPLNIALEQGLKEWDGKRGGLEIDLYPEPKEKSKIISQEKWDELMLGGLGENAAR